MYYTHDMMYGWGSYSIWSWLFMFLMMALIVVAIIWVIHTFGQSNHHSDSHTEALDILKQRYAKGEIDKSEFEEKKKDLQAK